jgi:hypothetical protein
MIGDHPASAGSLRRVTIDQIGELPPPLRNGVLGQKMPA